MRKIDFKSLPHHIAIVMDGNGRWAQRQGVGRIFGHIKGVKTVKHVVRACREMGIKFLTLYAFSMENWDRPDREVQALMKLLEKYLHSEEREMLDNNIRLLSIGNLEFLKDPIKKALLESTRKTSQNTGMTLILALSYGGRDEITEAAKKWQLMQWREEFHRKKLQRKCSRDICIPPIYLIRILLSEQAANTV